MKIVYYQLLSIVRLFFSVVPSASASTKSCSPVFSVLLYSVVTPSLTILNKFLLIRSFHLHGQTNREATQLFLQLLLSCFTCCFSCFTYCFSCFTYCFDCVTYCFGSFTSHLHLIFINY